MSVDSLLRKENNNFELLRLIAALMVIYGHAYAITPQMPLVDYLGSVVSGDYSGSIAVKFFFLLSGLVVTNSLLNSSNYVKFFISRIVRIFPALVFCVFVTCFLFSGFITKLPLTEYFTNPKIIDYFWGAITLRPTWELPGVFENNPIATVNGSLWTLSNEMFCYTLLVLMAVLFNLKSGKIPFLMAVFSIAGVLMLMRAGVLPYPQAANSEIFGMRVYFFFGVMLAVLKKRLIFSPLTIASLIALMFILRGTLALQFIAVPAVFVIAIWLSSIDFVKKIKLPGDYSYGVYLYGFFVQQVIKEFNPGMDLRLHQMLAMGISLVFGVISWHAIEWPAMKFWRKFL